MIQRISDLARRFWAIPFLRFLVVGGINTLFSFAVYALLILLGLHYVLAALISTVCGVLFNFRTIGTVVFKNGDNRLLLRFFGLYTITYFINIGLLKLFDLAGVGSLMAGAIIVLPMAVVSFLLMKRFIFGNLPRAQGK